MNQISLSVQESWNSYVKEMQDHLSAILHVAGDMQILLDSIGNKYDSFQEHMAKQKYQERIADKAMGISSTMSDMSKISQEVLDSFDKYEKYSSLMAMQNTIKSKAFSLALLLFLLGENAKPLLPRIGINTANPLDYLNAYRNGVASLRQQSSNKPAFDSLFCVSFCGQRTIYDLLRYSKTIAMWEQKGYTRASFQTKGLAKVRRIGAVSQSSTEGVSYTYIDSRLAIFDTGLLREHEQCVILNTNVIFKIGTKYYRTKESNLKPAWICLPLSILPDDSKNVSDNTDVTDDIDARIASLNLLGGSTR